MKRFFGYFFIIILFSCGSQESLFELGTTTEFRVELGLSTIESHFFVKGNVPIPIEFNIQNRNLDPSELESVTPQRALLFPKFGDEIDLDFINAVNVFIIDPSNNNRRKEIFYQDFVPLGQKTSIELIPTLINIQNLVEADRAILEIKLELRQFPPQAFDLQLNMDFGVFTME